MKEYFTSDRHERLSHTEVVLSLGFHGKPNDYVGLRKLLLQSDYYVPENANWSPSSEQDFQFVSDGKLKPEEAVKRYNTHDNEVEHDTLLMHFLQLYKSGVRIFHADYDRNSDDFLDLLPLTVLRDEYQNGALVLRTDQSFSKYVSWRWNLQVKKRTYQRTREQHIAEHLVANISTIQHEARWQLHKPKILVHYGMEHIDLPYPLRSLGFEHTKITLQQKWMYPQRMYQYIRKMDSGIDVPMETKAQHWFEDLVLHTYAAHFNPIMEQVDWQDMINRFCDQFTLKDIENLFMSLTSKKPRGLPPVRKILDPLVPWKSLLPRSYKLPEYDRQKEFIEVVAKDPWLKSQMYS